MSGRQLHFKVKTNLGLVQMIEVWEGKIDLQSTTILHRLRKGHNLVSSATVTPACSTHAHLLRSNRMLLKRDPYPIHTDQLLPLRPHWHSLKPSSHQSLERVQILLARHC